MSKIVLLNSTVVGTHTHYAGNVVDTVLQADEIRRVSSAGGQYVAATPAILEAARLATSLCNRAGNDTAIIDAIMLAAVAKEHHEEGKSGVLEVLFGWTDFPAPMFLGIVQGMLTVEKCVVEIVVPFDNGSRLSIGDDSDHERLMPFGASNIGYAYTYIKNSDYEYPIDSSVMLYFDSLTLPTIGSGRALVYYS